jgi:hypothetical protein
MFIKALSDKSHKDIFIKNQCMKSREKKFKEKGKLVAYRQKEKNIAFACKKIFGVGGRKKIYI